jgi:hypothetical protein
MPSDRNSSRATRNAVKTPMSTIPTARPPVVPPDGSIDHHKISILYWIGGPSEHLHR